VQGREGIVKEGFYCMTFYVSSLDNHDYIPDSCD